MEEESCRRDHGGGIMEEESWRRIMEEESWMRNHRGRIWEASRAIWTPRRHPGGTQEAPRRHPEAPRSTQRHPGGTQEVRGLWDSKTTILLEREMKKVVRPFACTGATRPSRSPQPVSKSGWANFTKNPRKHFTNSEDTPPEPLQQKLIGEHN